MAETKKDKRYDLRHWLFKHIEGLKKTFESKDYLATAFLLRDWIGRHATFTHKELILPHGDLDTRQLVEKLLACEGGVWCGGTSRLFSGIAHALPGLCIAEYNYGHRAEGLTHVTNIVGLKDGRCYNLDAYHGYHWVDRESQDLLEFGEMLRRIIHEDYESIQRVDVDLPRPAVAAPGDNGRRFRWLFGYGEIPEPVYAGGYAVYQNARPSYANLYHEESQNRLRADKLRGEQPLDEFMLDMMLVEANLSRFTPAVSASFTEYSVMNQLLQELIRR